MKDLKIAGARLPLLLRCFCLIGFLPEDRILPLCCSSFASSSPSSLPKVSTYFAFLSSPPNRPSASAPNLLQSPSSGSGSSSTPTASGQPGRLASCCCFTKLSIGRLWVISFSYLKLTGLEPSVYRTSSLGSQIVASSLQLGIISTLSRPFLSQTTVKTRQESAPTKGEPQKNEAKQRSFDLT